MLETQGCAAAMLEVCTACNPFTRKEEKFTCSREYILYMALGLLHRPRPLSGLNRVGYCSTSLRQGRHWSM